MHSSLRQAFDLLEQQRKNLLHLLAPLNEGQLNQSPQGKWSIAEILSHIISAEKLSCLYIRKKMQGAAEAADSGGWEDFKFFLLRISQRMPGLKFKAPSKVVERTEQYHDLPTLIREWDAVRADLKSTLEKIPDAHHKRKIYKHIRAGYLNVRQGLLFLREHIIHHTPQIKRLLSQR